MAKKEAPDFLLQGLQYDFVRGDIMSDSDNRILFHNVNTLGSFNLYWFRDRNDLAIQPRFSDSVSKYSTTNELIIDPAGVLEIISRRFCFADRTLIQGVSVSPWMARPNKSGDDWQYIQPPKHGSVRISPKDFAERLFRLLKAEVLSYCKEMGTIAVLLSGGMDSRICAMALYSLIEEKALNPNVVAVTWGLEGSRDVTYANEIATRLKWDWVHLPISPENLCENIEITAQQGCLYPPIHLHGVPRVKTIPGLDCVLVSSFGDSMGRGVYSGRHVTGLVPLKRYLRNWFGLIDSEVYKEARLKAVGDLLRYRALFPRQAEYAFLEIERQAHYMGRMLNPCVKYLNEFIPTFQVFTSPDILEFVWSIDPSCRNDEAYRALVARQMSVLADIPWSKTGKPFGNEGDAPDNYRKEFHLYGQWIRKDLNDHIYSLATSDDIAKLNIFCMSNLRRCLDFNRRAKRDRVTSMDEIAIWLASLAKMVRLYNISGIEAPSQASPVARMVNSMRPLFELLLFETAMDFKKGKSA